MGGTVSKNNLETLNQIAIDVTQQTTSRCVTTSTQQQLIEATNVAGDVVIEGSTLSQGSTIDMECLLSADTQSKIQSNIANEISQYADSQGQGMISALGSTKAEASANIKNMFESKVKLETLQESITKSMQVQAIRATNVGGNFVVRNVNMSQLASVVAKTIIKSTSYSDVINEIANKLDQKATAKEDSPLKPLTDMIGGVAGSITWIIIGVVAVAAVIVVVLIYYLFSSGVASEIVAKAPIGGPAGMAASAVTSAPQVKAPMAAPPATLPTAAPAATLPAPSAVPAATLPTGPATL